LPRPPAASNFFIVSLSALVPTMPSPRRPASSALLGPPTATMIGGGVFGSV